MRGRRTFRGSIAAMLLSLLTLTGTEARQGQGGITLAWDPSPDPGVAGYIVFVGTRSGNYTETIDVGSAMIFTYRTGVVGSRYFFRVAAYLPGPIVGARTAERSGIFVALREPPPEPDPDIEILPASLNRSSSAEQRALCRAAGDAACAGRTVADNLGSIGAMAALPDGRMLVVENRRLIRVIEGDRVVPEPALVVDDGRELTGIAVAPGRASVFVGAVEPGSRGALEFVITKYREIANVLGEGAVVASGLTVPDRAGAPFTVTPDGRLFIALPSDSSRRDPYAGRILRLNADGSTPADATAAGPVVGEGLSIPRSLAWNDRGLWMTGDDASGVARIALSPWTAEGFTLTAAGTRGLDLGVSARALVVTERPQGAALLTLLDADARLHQIVLNHDGSIVRSTPMAWLEGSRPEALAVGTAGQVYVAIRRLDGRGRVVDVSYE